MRTDTQNLVVVLVEDNPMDIDLTMRALARNNFLNPIQILRDGIEVLELIEKWKTGTPLPALILLDIKLPKITGLEVLKTLKSTAQTRCIPIVMLTSSTNEKDVNDAYRYGANSYIVKPVDFDKFSELTSTLCDYWTLLNIRPGRLE